jgi:hypothetical protein
MSLLDKLEGGQIVFCVFLVCVSSCTAVCSIAEREQKIVKPKCECICIKTENKELD